MEDRESPNKKKVIFWSTFFFVHYIFLESYLDFRRRKKQKRMEEEKGKNQGIWLTAGGLAESRDYACVSLVKHVYFKRREKDGERESSLKSNKSREQISPRRKTSFHHGGYISDIFFS